VKCRIWVITSVCQKRGHQPDTGPNVYTDYQAALRDYQHFCGSNVFPDPTVPYRHVHWKTKTVTRWDPVEIEPPPPTCSYCQTVVAYDSNRGCYCCNNMECPYYGSDVMTHFPPPATVAKFRLEHLRLRVRLGLAKGTLLPKEEHPTA
jgi:hypothetical protein